MAGSGFVLVADAEDHPYKALRAKAQRAAAAIAAPLPDVHLVGDRVVLVADAAHAPVLPELLRLGFRGER